jgi:hypothetical protein
MIATARTVAKIARVICVRRRLLQLRSLFMGDTLSNLNQRSPSDPVPPSARLGSAVSPGTGDSIHQLRDLACLRWAFRVA